MPSENASGHVCNVTLWTGRVLSWLPALFILFDGAMKIVKPPFVVEATAKMGFPVSALVPLGIILVASTLLYLIPRTSVLGAILLTGYLGGAVEFHVHTAPGVFEISFPVVFGALLWLGLVLRDRRLRSLLPWRTGTETGVAAPTETPGRVVDAARAPVTR